MGRGEETEKHVIFLGRVCKRMNEDNLIVNVVMGNIFQRLNEANLTVNVSKRYFVQIVIGCSGCWARKV